MPRKNSLLSLSAATLTQLACRPGASLVSRPVRADLSGAASKDSLGLAVEAKGPGNSLSRSRVCARRCAPRTANRRARSLGSVRGCARVRELDLLLTVARQAQKGVLEMRERQAASARNGLTAIDARRRATRGLARAARTPTMPAACASAVGQDNAFSGGADRGEKAQREAREHVQRARLALPVITSTLSHVRRAS